MELALLSQSVCELLNPNVCCGSKPASKASSFVKYPKGGIFKYLGYKR